MNPTYIEGREFIPTPRPERMVAYSHFGEDDSSIALRLFVGLKTITHNRTGMKIIPHKVVVIEMSDNDTLFSFDLDRSFARWLSVRLAEFANALGDVQ